MMGYGRFAGGRGFVGHGFGMLPHILGMIVGLVILVLFIILIVKIIRHKDGIFLFHHNHGQNITGNTNVNITGNALGILNERYAKGEIGDEEYQKIKAEITKVN
jgi:putative membrane protein